jgi:hypothetical protein
MCTISEDPEHAHDPGRVEREEIYLPPEILIHIFSYLPNGRASQTTYHAASLVSRSWNLAATAFLYRDPDLSGKNYGAFVRTICPSTKAHIRSSPLAPHVKVLDMTKLTYDGSKSLTARVLGRLKNNLEEFYAPQVSFG